MLYCVHLLYVHMYKGILLKTTAHFGMWSSKKMPLDNTQPNKNYYVVSNAGLARSRRTFNLSFKHLITHLTRHSCLTWARNKSLMMYGVLDLIELLHVRQGVPQMSAQQ